MKGIVSELQSEALDTSVRVSDLLRKALLVARKLKVPEFEAWILSELNGYSGEAKFPPYRHVKGEIKSKNPYTGEMLPVLFNDINNDGHIALTTRRCRQPISEIEALLVNNPSGQLSMAYSPEMQARMMKGTEMSVPPVLMIPAARLHGIVDSVRTSVLDFALELEEQGIRGEDLSFSEADRRAASNVVFNIGSMSHSQIQADAAHSQQILSNSNFDPNKLLEFIAKARADLNTLGLEKLSSDELNGELDTIEAQAKSPKPKSGIVKEALVSVRAILQSAAGSATGNALLAALRTYFGI